MPIHHIVLLKFKQGISPADVEEIRTRLRALPSQIPFIRGVKAGTKIKHPVDQDFSECIIFTFDDLDSLRNGYSPHKAHRDFQEYVTPYLQDLLIFDLDCNE